MKHKSRTSSKNLPEAGKSRSSFLQKDLENLIVGLESEKRESSYLDEQIKLIQFEMASLPKRRSFSLVKNTISVQEKKLELETNQLNQLKYRNKLLREQINDHRLEKSSYKQSLSQIKSSLDHTAKAAEVQKEKITKTDLEDNWQREKIGMLRSKSASQRSKFDEKLSNLASCLKNTFVKDSFYTESSYSAQGVEIISALKATVRTFESLTSQKKTELDSYLKFLHKLQNGFTDIKKATGVAEVSEVVTSCIKSEEQNQAVLFYLNNLNTEIDLLKETLERTQKKIQVFEDYKTQGVLRIQECLDKDRDQSEKIQAKTKKKQQKDEELQTIFKVSLPIIVRTYQLLLKAEFQLVVNEKVDLESLEKLNFESARSLLGSIEEMVNCLAVSQLKPARLSDRAKKVSTKRTRLQEMIEDADLYDEPEIEELKVPISLEELKSRAEIIAKKRKNFTRGKSSNPESRHAAIHNKEHNY